MTLEYLDEKRCAQMDTARCDPTTLIERIVSGVNRAKIVEVTLDALRTRQSLVKGERLVRHEMRAVLPKLSQPAEYSGRR